MQNKPQQEKYRPIMGREEHYVFAFGHFALFVVFVWFGMLKIMDHSPATPLVMALFDKTLAWLVPFDVFNTLFGLYEVIIGLLFIIPKTAKYAILLLIPHILTTITPLFIVPDMAWNSFLSPTLEGQYMIKNIVIIALAASIYVDMKKRFMRSIA